MLLELPYTERKLLLIAKVNSYERQRAIDSVLRDWVLFKLIYTIVDPNSAVFDVLCRWCWRMLTQRSNVMGGVVSENSVRSLFEANRRT